MGDAAHTHLNEVTHHELSAVQLVSLLSNVDCYCYHTRCVTHKASQS